MLQRAQDLYRLITQQRPAIAGVLIAAVLGTSLWQAQNFRLDASSDSLVLENDDDLRYYRETREQYGSDDFLVVTYDPQADLFSDAALDDLAQLKAGLLQVPGIASATTLLDVPLIASPPMSLTEIQQGIRTLRSPGTDRELARKEFTTSTLYRELIINAEGTVTAMQLNLQRDEAFQQLTEGDDQQQDDEGADADAEDLDVRGDEIDHVRGDHRHPAQMQFGALLELRHHCADPGDGSGQCGLILDLA